MRLRDTNKHQDLDELKAFVNLAVELDVRRYLEIGSRNGDSFYAVMANLRPSAFGMSIDLPENAETMGRMAATIMELRALGQQSTIFYGSSRFAAAAEGAKISAPFDLVLIDGDHTHNGVRSDWIGYGHLAPVIVFHDVGAPDGWTSSGVPNEVGRFWRELTNGLHNHNEPFRETREFITPGSKMGYGVVFR